MDTLHGLWQQLLYNVKRLIVWGNREPVLTFRRVLWVLTGGLYLSALYVLAAAGFLLTIIFAPFALQCLRLAAFAFDGGITLEPRPLITQPLELEQVRCRDPSWRCSLCLWVC